MGPSATGTCPRCNQSLSIEEQRRAFCFRCGKRIVNSCAEETPRTEQIPPSEPASTTNDVLPRTPLLFLSAAFTLLSVGPPYPLVAVAGPIRFMLTTNVFFLTSAALLVAAIACFFYSQTSSSRMSCVAIALCAAAILFTTIWGIRPSGDRSIASLVNFVFCFLIAHVAARVAREQAEAMGRTWWKHWLGVSSTVLILALIARVLGMVVRSWLFFSIATGGFYLGMLSISWALWILSLSSPREQKHPRVAGDAA